MSLNNESFSSLKISVWYFYSILSKILFIAFLLITANIGSKWYIHHTFFQLMFFYLTLFIIFILSKIRLLNFLKFFYNLSLVLISGSFHLYTGFLIDVFILVLRIIDRFVKVLSPSNTNICFTQTWFGD